MSKNHFLASARKSSAVFWADERGNTAIEFSLLAVGIMVAIVAAMAAFGTGFEAASADAADQQ